MLEKITPRYQALILLLIWGALLLTGGLLRFDAYGIDEAAARALLLVWSVVDRVINPIFVLGLPDLRALLFAPVGIYWPGSIIAAKVFTALICFAGILMCVRHYHRDNKEAALISAGLLLIAPLTLTQINSIGAGPFLLLGFCLGMWLDQAHRRGQRPLGGWFFIQILLIAIMTSIHPLALAYPLALFIEWYKNPVDHRQQRHMFIGIGIAVIFTLLIRGGWGDIAWLNNPLSVLSAVIWGGQGSFESITTSGSLIALLLAIILFFNFKKLFQDLLGRMFILTVIPGLLYADSSWAFITLALLLLTGSQNLLAANSKMGSQSFVGQRGLTMIILFITAVLFMQGDKFQQQSIASNLLTPEDALIQSLALDLEDINNDNILIMSQWPGRTMLAVRRPVLPLPPDFPDSATLLSNIKGTTHILFDPLTPDNKVLGSHLANLTAVSETLYMEQGGVIIGINTRQPAKKSTADSGSQTQDSTPNTPLN